MDAISALRRDIGRFCYTLAYVGVFNPSAYDFTRIYIHRLFIKEPLIAAREAGIVALTYLIRHIDISG